ncbi:MAG: aminotransferase class III-fold pyridoxal phosphate-dependent enzyme, partial [[Clostridium] innocuum]|nr:aminotransferase class III-fold pyridoxal phosphate-dependent enzyme [[Clostridium] innocuum]
YYSQPDSDVAELLCERCGFTNMFFANSGAEANEGAIKVARKYSSDHYGSGRHEIITLVNSFHGRTITALSATGQDHFHQHFDPFTPGFVHAVANDIADLKSKVSKRTCAVMLEMIQGEGGVLPLEPAFVSAVAELCRERDILLIVDEVQTGIGRCGTLYAYEQYGIHPDIVTTAKGLGNGLPIGGVLLSEKVSDTFHPGDHGTTFGGNPIACAGAYVVLKRMDEAFLSAVQKKGAYVEQRLSEMPHVVQVNGLGLMRGVVLDGVTARDVVAACIEKGVLLLTAKDKLRLLPPLTITLDELKEAMDVMEAVLTQIA